MYESDDILECARAIRPYLSEQLGAGAGAVDRALADLLAQAQVGDKVDNRILELLADHDVTREWMAMFLQGKHPPEVTRIYQPPPGSTEPVSVPKYACPEGDYVWYRRAVGVPVPVCPTHGLRLVPV